MKGIKNFYMIYLLKNLPFHVFSFISIALIITSFFVPPLGVIDGSVIAATGELFAFASLYCVIKAIDKGTTAKLSKGDVNLEFTKNKEDQDGDN